MKISVGMKLQDGPWGGGNHFGSCLVRYLREQGVEVCLDLDDPAIDLILLTEPRSDLQICAYTDREIVQYCARVKHAPVVVHRINECDQRKGSTGVNDIIAEANRCAHHTIFISSWLQQLFASHGLRPQSCSVIRNGACSEVFNSSGCKVWDQNEPLRIVTHHWSGHWMKGFDVYQQLDNMLADKEFNSRYHFTYIGRLPQDFAFKNSEYVAPLHGAALADELKKNHVYLSATLNEPAGFHHVEGACCGLPLLYLESGALPEYCSGFGVSFGGDNLIDRLQQLTADYAELQGRMAQYPHRSERMCAEYFQLFRRLVEERSPR